MQPSLIPNVSLVKLPAERWRICTPRSPFL